MMGAIAGDTIGLRYEQRPIMTKHFPHFNDWCDFSDDPVIALLIADAILAG
jgi:ADP-ribosylglycohydrolase